MICSVATLRAYRLDAFVEPADRRSERDAVHANLAFALERFEQLPERVVVDLRHARVVHLIDVDVVGLQTAQRRLERLAHERRREILRQLGLPAPRLPAVREKS